MTLTRDECYGSILKDEQMFFDTLPFISTIKKVAEVPLGYKSSRRNKTSEKAKTFKDLPPIVYHKFTGKSILNERLLYMIIQTMSFT